MIFFAKRGFTFVFYLLLNFESADIYEDRGSERKRERERERDIVSSNGRRASEESGVNRIRSRYIQKRKEFNKGAALQFQNL